MTFFVTPLQVQTVVPSGMSAGVVPAVADDPADDWARSDNRSDGNTASRWYNWQIVAMLASSPTTTAPCSLPSRTTNFRYEPFAVSVTMTISSSSSTGSVLPIDATVRPSAFNRVMDREPV